MEKLEYKILGKTIDSLGVFYGIFLILWGLIVSYVSGSNSITSLIPSFLGILILAFSILAKTFPNKRKLFMHIVVLFGFLTFVGGFRILSNLDNLFSERLWADISQIMMILTGGFFSLQCINSFIFIRRNK